MPPRTLPADFDFEAEQAPRTLPADFDFEAEEKQYDWDIPEPSKRYNKLSTPELKRDEAEMMFEKDVINTEWWRNASDEERRARRNDYWEKNNISEDMEMGQRLEQTIEESWDTPEEAELLGEHLTSREDLIPKEPAGSEYGGARELFNVDVPEQKPEQKPEQPRLFKKELPSEIPSIVDSIPKMVMGKFPQRVDHRAVDKEHLQDPERARVSDIVESEMNDAIVYLSKNVNLEGKVEDRVGEATGIMTKMLDENEGYDKLTDAGKARLFGRVMALLVKPTDEEIRALDKEKGQGVKGLKKAWKQVAYTIGGDNADQIEGMMAEEFMRTMDMTKSKDFRDMVAIYDRDAFGDSVLFPKWKNASWAKEVNDYITGADKGELLRVEQGTVGRGGMAYVAEYSPEIALAVGTMFLPTLSSAIVADLASWELIRLAKQGGEDYTAEKMYNDVELPAIIGASIVATAKMFKMGKNIKGAEGHFGKKFEDLSPDELREYKMYQENADEIIKSAEQSRKAEEDLAKDEEIAKNLNDEREINKAYDEIKDITSEAEVQSIFKQRKEAEIKDRLTELKKEFDDTTHKVATGQYTKEQGEQFLMDAGERILKKPMEEFDAKAKKVYDKWANTHGFQANAMGNAGFGGAMGGATLGAMSGIYEQMVNGEDVSTEEFLARIIGGGFGGYGVSKNTTTRGLGMYVGATPKPLHTTPPVTSKQSSKLAKQDAVDVVPTYAKGSQSNLADKGTREWIDDSGAKLKKVTYYSPADELAIGNKPKKLAEWEAKRTEALNTEGLTEQQIKNVNQNVDRAIESIKSKNPVAYIDTARSLQDKMPHRFKLEKLDDFYDHPELFKRYPELKDVRLQFRSGMRPTDKGFYNQSENLMVINKSLSDKEALSVIAHETQHGIQSLEDWARGGNTGEFKDIIHPDNKKVIADNVKYRTQVDKLERDRVYRDQKIKSEKLYDEKYRKQLDESTDYVETKKIMKAYKDESESLYPKLHSTERRTAKLRNQIRRSNPNINDSAYEQYTRLAGEQESRAVQAKLKHPNLDPYEALAKEEGKIPEPIVKFDDGSVARADAGEPKLNDFVKSFKNKKEFEDTVAELGYGNYDIPDMVAHIDKHTKGQANFKEIRENLSKAGRSFFKSKVKVKDLNVQDAERVSSENIGRISGGDVRIVVGKDGEVIDGRHRVMQAIKDGKEELDAYVSAGDIYGIIKNNKPIKTGGGKPKEKSGTVNLPYEATISDKFGGAVKQIMAEEKATMRAGFARESVLGGIIGSGVGAGVGAYNSEDKERGALAGAVFGGLIGAGSMSAFSRWVKKAKVDEGVLPSETGAGRLQRALQNKFNRVQQVMEVKSGGNPDMLPDSMNPVQAETLFHGRAEDRMNRFKEKIVKPLITKLAKSEYELEDLDLYLHARHAPERNASMRDRGFDGDNGSGMTDAEAKAIMDEFDTPEMREFGKYIDNLNEARLRMIEEEGLESDEMIDLIRNSGWDNYVPLQRVMDDTDSIQGTTSNKGFSNRAKEFKRAMGSEREVISPTVMSMVNFQSTLVHAEKNKVAKALYEFINEFPDDSLYTVAGAKYVPQYDEFGEVVRMNPNYNLADNVVNVKIDGKIKEIVLKDTALASAFKNLNAPQMNAVMQTLHKGVRYLASVSTSYNPEFVISNFMRDIQTAMANMPHTTMVNEAKMVKDVLPAIKGIHSGRGDWGKWFEEFSAQGGKTGWIDLMSVDTELEKLQKQILMLQGKAPGKKLFYDFLDKIDHINTAVENGVRLVAYRQMVEAGLTKKKSAVVAKELTVNFNKKGELGTTFNTLYMFANASVQGSTRMLKALSKSKKAQAGAIALTGTAVGLHMYNMSTNEEEYNKVPQYIKDTNLIFMRKDGTYMKMILPYGYNVFKSAGDMLGEKWTNGEVNGGVAPRLVSTLGNAFNPLGTSDSMMHTITPTLVKPLYEMDNNVNFFGAKIRPEKPQYQTDKKPDSQKYFPSVTESSKKITETINKYTDGTGREKGWLDISPENMDYMIKFAFGGLGGLAVNTETTIESMMDKDKKLNWNKVPFARKVYGEPEEKANSWNARSLYEKSGNKKMSEYETKQFNLKIKEGLKDGSIKPAYYKKMKREYDLNQLEVKLFRDMKIYGEPSKHQKIKIETAKMRYKTKHQDELQYSDKSIKQMKTMFKKKIQKIKFDED